MGLFSKIFGNAPKARTEGNGYFQTLTAYAPVFQTYAGSVYESELVRAAIDARARSISKLKFEMFGAANRSSATRC